MITAFLNGFVLAFGLIIPLGVQNIFVFNQGATQRKFTHALPSIITASLCDTILISVAIIGLSLVVLQIVWLKEVIFAVGLCFLLYMGYVTWNTKVSKVSLPKVHSAKKQILFAASVSLLNPHAILDSVAVIGTNSLRFNGTNKLSFAIACILVSWVWFFGLAITGRILHKADQTGKLLTATNKLSALIIWGVALFLAWELLKIFLPNFH